MRALVRDPARERGLARRRACSRPTSPQIRDDPAIAVVAEVMGGVEPTGGYVLDLLRAGKPVVSANKQLIARRGAELFAAAAERASSCASRPASARRSR